MTKSKFTKSSKENKTRINLYAKGIVHWRRPSPPSIAGKHSSGSESTSSSTSPPAKISPYHRRQQTSTFSTWSSQHRPFSLSSPSAAKALTISTTIYSYSAEFPAPEFSFRRRRIEGRRRRQRRISSGGRAVRRRWGSRFSRRRRRRRSGKRKRRK